MIKRIYTANRKTGFTLIELAIVLAVSSILASAIIPFYIKQAEIRAGEKTALEAAVIQEAARAYYIDNGSWPVDIDTLKSGGYLDSAWITDNPWNDPYSISSTPLTFTVSTNVPVEWANLVARDLPSTTISGGTVNSSIPIPGAASSFDSLPSGSVIIWTGPSCPEGFSRLSELDGKFLVGGSSYVVNAGGSNTQTHSIPGHSHSFSAMSQGSDPSGTSVAWDAPPGWNTPGRPRAAATFGSHQHRVSGTTSSWSGITEPADNRPEFATVLLCRRD